MMSNAATGGARAPARKSFLSRMLGDASWSDAIAHKDFGMIIDMFNKWFFGVGFAALLLAGIGAGLSGIDGLGPEVRSANHAILAQDNHATADKPDGTATTVPPPAADWQDALLRQGGLGFRIFALGLVLAGACTSIGWLFGLIFGVPRAAAQTTDANVAAALDKAKTPETTSSRKTASRVNTNLEDISDWLTKTLVGVGLVELQSLPRFLGDLAFAINRFGFDWSDHGQLLALGIMLYFFPGGFWLGYVGTRTMLTGLFDLFDGGWKKQVTMSALVDNLEIDGLNQIRPASGDVALADAAVLGKPLQELESTNEIIAWAAAQARAGNLQTAQIALENVRGTDPDNQTAIRQLVKVYLARGEFDNARELGRKLIDNSPPKMLAALYDLPQDDPPGGYKLAQQIGNQLLTDPATKDAAENSASMHVWLASAYAQEYSNLLYPKSDAAPLQPGDPAAAAAKARVLVEIRKAVALNPDMRRVLFEMWRPDLAEDKDRATIDNDLSAFAKADPDLGKLLDPNYVAPSTENDDTKKQADPPEPPVKKDDTAGGEGNAGADKPT
jgi:hypothetical protein